jgi:hypothetical protein
MITRQQYNDALNLVEEYHLQIKNEIKILDSVNKTEMILWLAENESKMSLRLKNILRITIEQNYTEHTFIYKYVEIITEHNFMRIRTAGKLTWEEFTKLRGY